MPPTFKTKRLETLKELDIISKDIREELRGLTNLASEICNAPMSLINILDEETTVGDCQRNFLLQKVIR